MKRSINYLLSTVLVMALCMLFPFAVLASDMDVGFADEASIQEYEIYPEANPVVDSEDLEIEDPLTQESNQDHHAEDIAESKTTEEDVIQEDATQGSVVDDEPAPVEDDAAEQDNETLQENSATQEETPDPESPLETEETIFREDDLNADDSSAGEETTAPDEKANSDHLTDGDETVTPEEDPMKETPDSDKKTENNEVAATAEITEEESQEISLNSLSTLNVEATPQFRVELVNGYLVLRDLKSGEIRKDNKWVIDSVTNKAYFPNSQGHLYHERFITFGPDIAYYMGADGSKLSNQIVEVSSNLHLLNPDGLLNKSNRWAILNGNEYFPNAEGRLYRNRFITFGPDIAYYMGADGSKLSNQIVEVSSNLHLLNPDGLLNKSNRWATLNGNEYFPNAEGRLYRNRFITFGPAYAYYLGSDGSKLSNQIVEVNQNLHLLNPNGLLNKSNRWTSLNGKDYFPNDKGVLYRNQFISFGPTVQYYLDNSGAKVIGQHEVQGINYTFDHSGRFIPTYKGWTTLKNQLYYFASNGFPTKGWFDVTGKTYHSGSTGIVSKGIQTINQNVYYFDVRPGVQYPKMVRNEKLSFGSYIYYFNQDGIGIRLSNAPLGSRQDGTYLTNKNFILTIKNGLATIDGTLIVNKTFTLPSTYNPGLTYSTQTAFNTMRNAMNDQGLSLWIASGFRSYATQSQLFQQYVDAHGVAEAETFSARAGHSEHQSGLAMDVNSISDSFAYTNEGIWLHNNAWRHGFILRYPRNKQGVTGYIYEPWHFRYVGYDLARKLYNNGSWLTVEEYFGIPSHY